MGRGRGEGREGEREGDGKEEKEGERMKFIIKREIERKDLENLQPGRRIKNKMLGRKHQECGWATFSDIIMEPGAIHQDNRRMSLMAPWRLS